MNRKVVNYRNWKRSRKPYGHCPCDFLQHYGYRGVAAIETLDGLSPLMATRKWLTDHPEVPGDAVYLYERLSWRGRPQLAIYVQAA